MDDSVSTISGIIPLSGSAIDTGLIAGLLTLVFLLMCSALISGSEVAFFSLSPSHKKQLEDDDSRISDMILELTEKTKQLLATILITNNFVNVGIILLSSLISQSLFDFGSIEVFGIVIKSSIVAFLVNVISITFIILLFGEVIPKVYASRFPLRLSIITGLPLHYAYRFLNALGLVGLLVNSTRFIDKRIKRKSDSLSVDELSHALDITDTDDIKEDEQRILKGIVKFGNTDVKQVMTQRLEVVSAEYRLPFNELLDEVVPTGFSRIPIYEDNFDNIKGILYLKDLLPHINETSGFKWQELLREPFYVPENKKIDDLLKEFQEKKTHLAIVVDEYGGSSGIITLEDVIEEIVGDISDEFDDEDDLFYSKLDDHNYVFEGKTALNDMYRVLGIEGGVFEAHKGESDTLAGFVLELVGKIPQKNERVEFQNYIFTVESSDKRRIKRVKVTIKNEESDNEDN